MLRHFQPLAAIALTLAVILSSCGSDPIVQTTMERTPRATAVEAAGDATRPIEDQADLPPPAWKSAPLVADGFVRAADAGRIDVCSLYNSEQLAGLLGEFWTLEAGIAAQSRCIWQATSSDTSGALISIAVEDRAGEFLSSPGNGSYQFESTQGPAVALAKADSVIVVNVTTNDADIAAAVLNEVEAERRISGDLDRRLSS